MVSQPSSLHNWISNDNTYINNKIKTSTDSLPLNQLTGEQAPVTISIFISQDQQSSVIISIFISQDQWVKIVSMKEKQGK
jgi:hypothetical protein